MDKNSLLQSTFEIVTWPEIQDYMTMDNFKENAVLINEEPFLDIVGSSAYFVNTEWKKMDILIVKHNLTTLKYNNIRQVCPYKDLGSAKDYIIILLFLMQPVVSDKPE